MAADRHEFSGGCHCGAIRFHFLAKGRLQVVNCNCSICRMVCYQHVFVPHDELVLEHDPALLAEYTFNTGTARHWFCRQCGIKSYYQPRSHPGHYSVNLRCLDGYPGLEADYSDFDGSDWEGNIDALRD